MLFKKCCNSIFKYGEDIIYAFVGFTLVISAFLIGFSIIVSGVHVFVEGDIIGGVIDIIDKLLLALMIIEILYTVRASFNEHSFAAEPFLVVGLIAAVRRILVISVESAHLSDAASDAFKGYMIEMAILGFLVLAFSVSIVLLHRNPRKSASI